MKRSFFILTLAAYLCCAATTQAANTWVPVTASEAPQNLQIMHPKNFLVYRFNNEEQRLQLFALSTSPSEGMVISLPLPDGTFRDFKVWQAPMMPADLAAQFPEIRTFTAEAVNDPRVTAKLDYTLYGFHAMIFDGENTSFIDPYDNFSDGYYMVHYKRDEIRAYTDMMKCEVHNYAEQGPGGASTTILSKQPEKAAAKTVNGYDLRTYRLALSADHYYCQKATGVSSPTTAQALAKMTTTMNRVNGVYEREFSVHMDFVSAETSIIFTTSTGDPFDAIDTDPNACTNKNQTVCDGTILSANYDIGHVFTTGAGGLSSFGVVCKTGRKAQSVTGSSTPTGDGFDIDFVAHEMGHEFAGAHTFNNGTDGSCGGDNRSQPTAYEPGSGSTIMAYAGICTPDNIQSHSDPYFHAANLAQMQAYLTGSGNACAVKTPTGNKLVGYSPFAATYSIPYLTPFELTAPVLTDSVADSVVLYDWEEFDQGINDVNNEGTTFAATHDIGPLFRSFSPTTSATRVFPRMSIVLVGVLSSGGEKVPDVARTLNFKCTFRDIINNHGCITIPDDKITLNAINTGAGFKVTSQNATGISYTGGSTQIITWDVVSTNVAPINAANVDIFLSTDGGTTWPYTVGTYPNTGSATVIVPNPPTTSTARFKVKGAGNVFFNVNGKSFKINNNSDLVGVKQVNVTANDAAIFPVPVSNVLHVVSAGTQKMEVYNLVGQQVWNGSMNKTMDIPVAEWAKGMYYIRLTDSNNQSVVKKFVVE
ncbi:MAG: hypothetical protein JWQ38_3138 [Flavipsychrobacter sp.]|nr:hypothetical protein [Flavipsychrobacter sp.]